MTTLYKESRFKVGQIWESPVSKFVVLSVSPTHSKSALIQDTKYGKLWTEIFVAQGAGYKLVGTTSVKGHSRKQQTCKISDMLNIGMNMMTSTQHIRGITKVNAHNRWSILKLIRSTVGEQYSNLLMSIRLEKVIAKLKSVGMSHDDITRELLKLREDEFIEMEVGTPIGIWDDEELKKYTVSSSKNRFAHIKLTHKGFDSIR